MSIDTDLRAEGEPEREYNAGITARSPRKRVTAGAVFHDERGRILMVEPIYKPGLEIPGGMVEEDESPLRGCVREVREELGISPPIGDLLVVDWVPWHGAWSDAVMFVFDGGVLTPEQVARIRLQEDELASFVYLTLTELTPHVRPSMARRLRGALAALDAGRPFYLDFGRRPDGRDAV